MHVPGGRTNGISVPGDPGAERALRVFFHLRRYAVLYVFGVVAALGIALLPSTETGQLAAGGGAAGTGSFGASAPSAAASSGSETAATTGGGLGAAASVGSSASSGAIGVGGTATGPTAAGAASGAAGTGGGAPSSAAPAVPTPAGSSPVQIGTGTTVGGYPCRPGVRQLPYSQYADPCEAAWHGDNGGATWNGVTATTITIAVRHTADATGPNAAAAEAEVEAAGGDPYTEQRQEVQDLVDYFNKTFELYGRHVKLVDFNGVGNYTDELQSQDQAGACADADTAANTIHAFGVVDYLGLQETGPFSACAARYHLWVPLGAPYFPESSFDQWNPYVWNVTMNCTLIAKEVAEETGKELAPYGAKWAGNDGILSLTNQPRKFATYVPNNPEYQECVATTKQIEESQYHIPASRLDQYNYALDVSTFPEDAQRAIIQFAADHDTTVVLACDEISPIFLTQDAVQQNYYPEWNIIGVALTDTDNWAQLWDQKEVAGRLFGLSESGSTTAGLNPNGEVAIAWKAASGRALGTDTTIPPLYAQLLFMFDQLQAAGPDLTPFTIASGSRRLVSGGGPTGFSGTWSLAQYHTAIIDAREVWWNANERSPANGKMGHYVALYGGRRFGLGQFPNGEPPYFQQ